MPEGHTTQRRRRCSGTLLCEALGANGGPRRLYVPLEAWGKLTEALSALHTGVVVTVQNTLYWCKYVPKGGAEQGTLAVVRMCGVRVPAHVPMIVGS